MSQLLASLAFWLLLAVIVAMPMKWLASKVPADGKVPTEVSLACFAWLCGAMSVLAGFACDVLPRLYGVLMEAAK